ncbi:E3 SUMO-protein ligase NSE2 isoform X3 [Physeter macrocephalus]|uniref:E3 SUMO-protein ligase NSE2 isoform X3 n=1 Tax=Physeter macrocephalus TaxID=9755 RepID=A0A9W2X795_PHYMC|nr:E3 SUMO-protein ligase NSE2 isoform X3 [Physeter catodon]
MPGRSTSSSGSTGFISFSGVESALSSLKNFQSCISSGMDTASSVALDLVETQTEVSSEYSMDKAMVEFAMMDRELNHYLKAVQSTINHVKEERPEKIPNLKLLVEKKFLALQNKNSDADFQNNEKFAQFKQQLKELKKQYKYPGMGLLAPMELPDCFPKRLRHFTLPPAMCEGSNRFTSSPTLIIICLFDCSHPSGCELVSHCFDVCFPDGLIL